jgi:hypothetical protein
VTFSKRSRADRLGSVAGAMVAICVLVSVIGCGLARFELPAPNPPAATLLASSVDDIDRADLQQDLLSTAHKPVDAIAPHQRAVPQRLRTLTMWRWWYRPAAWLASQHRFGVADAYTLNVSRTGRELLTHFCVSLC